ncbi:hypothetical protein QYE76_067743 [Lolium multiflorum]|uniref:Transposase (putative) gypsy type domain-containing protein n=1 Tax=Lolium multiflorum TaxID=4521 RepID=A0AAD8WB91_LOLMU|nr:hypothetical protein QYE76_067743 [Lolium multiflorum]
MISAHWSFIRDTVVPKPEPRSGHDQGLGGTRIIAPCSEFFLSILKTYGLQPHNICPNSYLLLSNFATLCEGHLGIRPDVKLWQFFFRVKKETKDKAMLNCGSMTFMLRPGRMYPPHDSHESVRTGTPDGFTRRMCQSGDPRRSPQIQQRASGRARKLSFIPSLSLTPIPEKAGESPARYIGGGKLTHHTSRPRQRRYGGGGSEDEEEEEEQAPRKAVPRPTKVPAQSFRLRASGEASTKKPKIVTPSARLKEGGAGTFENAFTAGKHSRPIIPGAPTPTTAATRTASQKPIIEFMKKSPAVGPATPLRQALPTLLHRHLLLGGSISPSCRKHPTGNNSGASSSPATTSSELENLRSSYQELEIKLKEAEQQKESAKKQLAEKNSELIREKGEFVLKHNADSETIKRQQELNGLRKYMETAEHHWDPLAENIWSHSDTLKSAGTNFPGMMFFLLAMQGSYILTEDMPQLVIEEEPTAVSSADGHSSGAGSVTRNSMTRWFFRGTSPLKTNFKRARRGSPSCGIRNRLPGPAPRMLRRGNQDQRATSDEDEESDEDVSSPAEGAKGKDPEGNASPSKAE